MNKAILFEYNTLKVCIIFNSESKFHHFGLPSIAYLSFKNMKWILTQTFFSASQKFFDTQTFFCVHAHISSISVRPTPRKNYKKGFFVFFTCFRAF